MSNPDLEVLKADIEAICDLATKAARKLEGLQEESSLPEDIDFVVHRIRRNIADPTDMKSLHQTRTMNKNPMSNRED